ncbi:hypothetical protein GCM10007190_13820 [Macrococcus hajekii]|uniref:hypothetical protein n=1 Tax=Macrococcus hajekii TaxID=198482 RepID=UPI00166F2477|nr:hypothetical protein [Macrococcus hajekii]GGB07001.1 hypothetical protein GCM10007190_13820 [Macrococcus hajekii]
MLHILEQIKNYTTVIFSTHILSDIESICDEVIVLSHQQLLTLDEIQKRYPALNKITVEMKVSEREQQCLSEHYEVQGRSDKIIMEIELGGNTKMIETQKLYQQLMRLNVYPEYIAINVQTLEQLYREAVE